MFESFETARLIVRRLTMDDAPELTAISDVAQVSQWMSFMEGGFPLGKACAMITAQSETRECFFAVRLRNGALAGALGMVDHPEGTIEIGYWFGVDYQGNGYGYEAVRACLEQITADLVVEGDDFGRSVTRHQRPLHLDSNHPLCANTGQPSKTCRTGHFRPKVEVPSSGRLRLNPTD
jgi:[ribosomal protein S5]-alanine N-acetyltransferase